ncbi:MAG: hypothetical protein IKV96_04365 [Firmicutes bacterium]|nr:hypothetical protein [Bacillota bacterium]
MKLTTREVTVFAMLGALMWASKIIMELLPNIHLIGVLTIAYTVVYRKKALYPLCLFILLTGLLGGFATWWIPYLYVWTVLWGAVMLLPKKIPAKFMPVIYTLLCGAHGFLYGVIYAPVNALLYGMSFDGMIAWIVAGLPFDMIHGVSNLICSVLILPIIKVLTMMERQVVKTAPIISNCSADTK